jgi:uncharacterized protein
MTNAAASPGQKFSLRAFLQGMAVVIALYAVLAGWLWHFRKATEIRLQAALASQAAPIEFPPAPATATAPRIFGTPAPSARNISAPPVTAPLVTKPPVITAVTPVTATPVTAASAIASLPPAPIDGLYETTPKGRLPVIRKSDGLTPFKAYRRPFDRAAAKGPVISIAIVDLGISDSASQAALKDMPPEISLDISPYAANPDSLVNEARQKGHEVWLTLPLESENYPRIDTGADTLLIGMPEQQNAVKLAQVLGSTVGYAGVITSRNPAFMKSVGDMKPILNAIYDRGLCFVDSSESPGVEPQTLAMGRNAPYANVDAWIDTSTDPQDIRKALAKLEERARSHGAAAGLIHPLPVSYQEVLKWIDGLPAKGIVLAPLSAQTGQ